MQVLVLLAMSMLASCGVHALSCLPCDKRECAKVKCKGDVVKDVCGCCDKCAKMAGESCGGPWNANGECDGSLTCMKPRPVAPGWDQQDGKCGYKKTVGTFIGRPQTECPDRCYPIISPCHNAKCSAFPDAICKPNYCGGCNAEFFLGGRDVTAECKRRVAPTRGCVHNGVTYKPGDNFKKDCNTCFCGPNGQAGCTKMFCLQMSKPAAGCLHKGQKYTVGQRFSDDCNSYTCRRSGRVACTKKACAKEQGCVHKGTKYASGSNFKDQCNTCTCSTNGKVSCTKMFCFPWMNLGNLLNFRGFGRKSCSYNGRTYAVGQTFQGECNNMCMCSSSGSPICTRMGCADSINSRLGKAQRRRLERTRISTNKNE